MKVVLNVFTGDLLLIPVVVGGSPDLGADAFTTEGSDRLLTEGGDYLVPEEV